MSFRQAVVATMLASAFAANLHDRSYYEAKFYGWMKEHNIQISSGENFVKMIQNFANNDDIIDQHNAQKSTYTLGHNQFSGMSEAEFKAYVAGFKRPETKVQGTYTHNAPSDLSSLAATVDWVSAGAVTGVKDQGQCGSCWSFSTTGSLEGAYYNKYKTLVSFSEQNLVDCDNRKNTPKGTDMGCNGGLMDSAFTWIMANGGLCTEAAYPYTAKDGTCQTSCTKDTKAKPASFTDVKTKDDAAMMSALNKGPVSIAIEASAAFQLYKSGVFTGTCGDALDHGVLATGYGVDGANEYYNVKNSWGTAWGEKGYIRLVKGTNLNKGAGQCGMLIEPSYPNL